MTRAAKGQQQLIDIACHVVAERDLAIAIIDGTTEEVNGRERQKWFWLPRSQIEIEKQRAGSYIVTLPEWLALEKELI